MAYGLAFSDHNLRCDIIITLHSSGFLFNLRLGELSKNCLLTYLLILLKMQMKHSKYQIGDGVAQYQLYKFLFIQIPIFYGSVPK